MGWKLHNYFIRDLDKFGNERLQIGKSKDTVIALTVEDFQRRSNYVEELNARDLDALIAIQRMRGDKMVKYALIEKNTRIATPFSAFILTIIGVSLSSRKRRGGIGLNIGIGLALSFSYILFMRFSQMFVHTDTLPPLIAIWLPNILYAFIAYGLYRMAPK
jgi:lipopolysaccharide export system permease protein